MQRILILAAVVLTAPLWLTLLAVAMAFRAIQLLVLYGLAWGWWMGRDRRRVLFVYSNSPNWKAYVEANILPHLPQNSVVLNWSDRLSWNRFTVSVMLFRFFAGPKEFNPIGLVFERFNVVKPFRFWQAFRDAKHGREDALRLVESRFLDAARGQHRV